MSEDSNPYFLFLFRSACSAAKGVGNDWTQIPEDIDELTVEEVAVCLTKLKLGKYTEAFWENCMDGELLKSMKDDENMAAMLGEGFGMNAMEAHKLWMFCQRGWRPK
jgi:hypothetical protein